MQKLRLFIISALSLVLTTTSICWASMNAHACCGDPAAKMSKATHTELALCCLTPAVVEAKAILPFQTGGDLPLASLPSSLRLLEAHYQHASLRQSMLDNHHVPDQSDRHLELSILLN